MFEVTAVWMPGEFPGPARLLLVPGVVHLKEPAAVFEAMVTGWSRQQHSRQLGEGTVRSRERLIRRFQEFCDSYPWQWTPADVEDFTVSLTSGTERRALSTIRGYHLTLRMFCDYITDSRYEWPTQCHNRFGQVPSQVCNEWNTVAHLNDYEGKPQRRPLTYRELELLFDWLDDRVDQIARSGRKGSLAALRDATMLKTTYAFGLRRNELARLDVADCSRIRTCATGEPTGRCTFVLGKRPPDRCLVGGRCWRFRNSIGPLTASGSGSSRLCRCMGRAGIPRCG